MDIVLEKEDKELLDNITDSEQLFESAFNVRKNGCPFVKKETETIKIVSQKEGKEGIEIYVKNNGEKQLVNIPVLITKGGLDDLVYNDFYIESGAQVTIVAGCGIHNCDKSDSRHNGIHSFYLEEGAKVNYIEKHYGSGDGEGAKVLNPITRVFLKKNSSLEMETVQIEGVDSTIRETIAKLEDNTNLVIKEKIKTSKNQYAKTIFEVDLDGVNSSCHLISRAVAEDNSKQEFISNLRGNNKCYAHSECDAILKDNGIALANPIVLANNVDANLIHEAVIGKIAGEQLLKLMSLGLSEKEAEEVIINGFLK